MKVMTHIQEETNEIEQVMERGAWEAYEIEHRTEFRIITIGVEVFMEIESTEYHRSCGFGNQTVRKLEPENEIQKVLFAKLIEKGEKEGKEVQEYRVRRSTEYSYIWARAAVMLNKLAKEAGLVA